MVGRFAFHCPDPERGRRMAESKRIILGDDHAQTVRAARSALAESGCQVIAAETLTELAEAVSHEIPDCLILDAALPGEGVAEFCMRIRRKSKTQKPLSILLLVPPRFNAAELAVIRPHVDACLYKPFHVDELVARVQALTADPANNRYEIPAIVERGEVVSEETSLGMRGLLGREIAGCRLERVLGRGATGVVYLGRHTMLDMPVAVKLLPKYLAGQAPDDLQRFERGARAAAQVRHPNVVQVLNAGVEDDFCFLVQRYIEGEPLRDRIESDGRMAQTAVLRILREVADGLAAVHRLELVHRDVKPGNIILALSGAAMLTDFGFARPVGRGDISSRCALVGTPYYMSPEQCDNQPLDGRSDLYSLGATAYHAITGRLPIQGDTPIAVLRGHLDRMPPSPDTVVHGIARPLVRVIMRLLAKNPSERYPTAECLVAELDALTLSD